MNNFAQLVQVLIKDEADGKPRHEHVLQLGKTPEILTTKGGFPSLPLVIKASVISKACFDHGIKTSVLKRLPEIVRTPKAIFKSASTPDSAVVLTFEVQGDAPIIIPLHKEKKIGRYTYNVVASVYAKEGPNPETKWTNSGLLLWKENKKEGL